MPNTTNNVVKSENVEETGTTTETTNVQYPLPNVEETAKPKEKTENKKNEELTKLAERIGTKFDKGIVANIPVSENVWKLVHSYFRHGKDGGKTENPVTVEFKGKQEKCENANEFLSFVLHTFINENLSDMETAFANREEVSKRDNLAKIKTVEDADDEIAKLLKKLADIEAKKKNLL